MRGAGAGGDREGGSWHYNIAGLYYIVVTYSITTPHCL